MIRFKCIFLCDTVAFCFNRDINTIFRYMYVSLCICHNFQQLLRFDWNDRSRDYETTTVLNILFKPTL